MMQNTTQKTNDRTTRTPLKTGAELYRRNVNKLILLRECNTLCTSRAYLNVQQFNMNGLGLMPVARYNLQPLLPTTSRFTKNIRQYKAMKNHIFSFIIVLTGSCR